MSEKLMTRKEIEKAHSGLEVHLCECTDCDSNWKLLNAISDQAALLSEMEEWAKSNNDALNYSVFESMLREARKRLEDKG